MSAIIALASRSLTPVEMRYSQTEHEALAISWGITHFHLYLSGSRFTVITDHKPLVPLFNNPYSKPPARIERWLLHLQQYDYTVVYEPGASNPADYLSRHPSAGTSVTMPNAEEHINYVVDNAVPKSVDIDEISTSTSGDPVLQMCMKAINENSWHTIISCSLNRNLKQSLTL